MTFIYIGTKKIQLIDDCLSILNDPSKLEYLIIQVERGQLTNDVYNQIKKLKFDEYFGLQHYKFLYTKSIKICNNLIDILLSQNKEPHEKLALFRKTKWMCGLFCETYKKISQNNQFSEAIYQKIPKELLSLIDELFHSQDDWFLKL